LPPPESGVASYLAYLAYRAVRTVCGFFLRQASSQWWLKNRRRPQRSILILGRDRRLSAAAIGQFGRSLELLNRKSEQGRMPASSPLAIAHQTIRSQLPCTFLQAKALKNPLSFAAPLTPVGAFALALVLGSCPVASQRNSAVPYNQQSTAIALTLAVK